MATDFVIPKHGVTNKQVLGESNYSASAAADVLDDLNDHDALYITEEDAYERCEALARGFLQLSPCQRSQAVDVLAANLRYLCSSLQQLLGAAAAGDAAAADPPSPETLQRHKNGLRMIVHLLHIIAMQANKDAEQSRDAENAGGAKAGKAPGRGRKAAAAAAEDGGAGGWDWQHSRQQVLLAVHDVMRADLCTLFKGLAAAERMVNLCVELALQALEAPTVTKQGWPAVCDVLIRGAVQHEQLDFVAAALMERARRHEHVPVLAAQAAKVAEERYNSTQLAVKLLAEFWSCSPEDYDTQYASNAKSVRQAGEVVTLLAELLPKVVSNHISQLRPYLGCSKASSIRAALMAATGSILLQVYPTSALSSSLGAGAAQAHLRSKEALLALLLSRMLDKASYVRQRVLQTWAKLVEEGCVPLPHWNTLLTQAISRLGDESQLVVKAALQLLSKMLHQGVFPPPLNTQAYMKTLRDTEEQLAALKPAKKQQLGEGRDNSSGGDAGSGSSDDEDDEEEEAEGGEGQAGAAWAPGDIKVEDGQDDGDTAMGDAAADKEQEEEKEQDTGDEHGSPNNNTSSSSAAHADAHAQVTKLRSLVASLKEGVSFCKHLASSLPQVQQLLASPHAGVVQDAIVFLTMCKTYEVTGAAKALRGMWPLVFSKVEAVRDAVLDSWNILHLRSRSPRDQVNHLVTEVIPGCSLAELTALEAILTALAQQGSLAAPVLVHLCVETLCSHYATLQEQQQAEKKQQPGGRQRGGPQKQDNDTSASAMDTETDGSGATQSVGAGNVDNSSDEKPDEEKLTRADSVQPMRDVSALLSMLAAAQPGAIKAKYVQFLLQVGFAPDLADAWVARHTCLTLRHAAPNLVPHLPTSPAANPAAAALNSNSSIRGGGSSSSNTSTATAAAGTDPVTAETQQAMLAALVRLLVGHPAASLTPNWPAAAEAAVAAVYALADKPQDVLAATLEAMFRRCRPNNPAGGASQQQQQQQSQSAEPLPGLSAAALSRLFFVVGRTALQHLLCIEQLGKAIRQTRLAAGRAAAEAADRARETAAAAAAGAGGKRGGSKAAAAAAAVAAAQQQQQADDVGAMLGAGAVTADAELDELVEAIEAQILSRNELLGKYGALLSKMVHLRAFITYPPQLQASALLALTQLMAVDGGYCADNVALLFTLLHKRLVAAPVRVNMVVALADLASRWPNVLEPWTAYMYDPLSDPDPGVKLSALSSLTHLVLGGMVKAKGNVAKVAVLLVDDEQELVDRAVLFFKSLADSGSGSSRTAASAAAGASAANPVYNLLPDCLSALLAKSDPPLREEQMQVIMTQLLAYVEGKQAESLRERLVVRLQLGGPREWRLVAWCIAQLGYSEKGLRRVMEMVGCYRHTLGEQQVFDMFMNMARKATGAKAVAAAAAGESSGANTTTTTTATASGSALLLSSSGGGGLGGDFKSSVEEWVVDLVASREAAIEAAEVEALTQQQQQQQRREKQQEEGEEAELGGDKEPAGQQQQRPHEVAKEEGVGEGEKQQRLQAEEGMQVEEAATTPAATTPAAAEEVPADGQGLKQQQREEELIQLVQSQDMQSQDDLEPGLLEAAAAAVAAAGMQRMSLAGSAGARAGSSRGASSVSAAASGAAARGGRRAAGSSAAVPSSGSTRRGGSRATAAAAVASSAASASGRGGRKASTQQQQSSGAAAAGANTRRTGRGAAASAAVFVDDSSSSDDGDDSANDSSSDGGSDDAAAVSGSGRRASAAAAAQAGTRSGSRRGGQAAAAATTTTSRRSAAAAQRVVVKEEADSDSSSSEDDD